jgi:hypothetical protein
LHERHGIGVLRVGTAVAVVALVAFRSADDERIQEELNDVARTHATAVSVGLESQTQALAAVRALDQVTEHVNSGQFAGL